MSEFNGKVVVITGGSSGIGKALALKLNDSNANIVIFARDQEKIEETVKKLDSAIGVQGDISCIQDLERLFLITEKTFGKVDVLIANAGAANKSVLSDVDSDHFDEIVSTNFKGTFFTVKTGLDYLKDGSSICLVSSKTSYLAWEGQSIYSATKSAVKTLAKNFAADLLQRGIRVNSISPGFTDTPFSKISREENARFLNKIPSSYL